jgi:hypothetical protein
MCGFFLVEHMSLTIRSPRELLIRDGIDPDTAWEDDEGLTSIQRARLRSIGRSVFYRRRAEGKLPDGPTTSGMGKDGKQN